MGLTHLSRVQHSSNTEVNSEYDEFEAVQLQEDEQKIAELKNEIATNTAAISHVLTAVDVVSGLKENGVSNNISAAVFGEHLAAAGVPDAIATASSVGCESAGEEIGNEAMDTAKDIINGIIRWLAEKWTELKALVRRTLTKYFGSAKRGGEKWAKIKTIVEKYQDESRTLDDKSALEVKSGAKWMVLGLKGDTNPKLPIAFDKIPEEIEKFETIVTGLEDILSDESKLDFPEDIAEIKSSNGKLASGYVRELRKPIKLKCESFGIGGDYYDAVGIGLLGRNVFGTFTRYTRTNTDENTEAGVRDATRFLNGINYGIRNSNTELKALDEVKVAVPSLDAIEAVADAYIESSTKVLALGVSKKLVKMEKAFDKAIESTKKWTKDADQDNGDERRMAVAAANLGVARINLANDASLGLASDTIRCYGAMIMAHASIARSALGRYKVAD